jgi:hypothetical protein
MQGLCPINSSSCYHGSLDNWKVIHVTATTFNLLIFKVRVKVEVTLQLTASQRVFGVEPILVLMTRCLLLFDSNCRVFVGHPLWREVRFCHFPDRAFSISKSKLFYDWRSFSQYALVSRTFWDLHLDITSCRNVCAWKLRSSSCGTPSLRRGRVCNLQGDHSMVQVAQNP